MRPLNVLSNGAYVVVPAQHLQEFHAQGMGWFEYEQLRVRMTHEEALAAHNEKWAALGYGQRFTH